MTSTTSQSGYPVRLTGDLDPKLSRWLWLVKMFLAIPHYVVLAVLLVTFVLATLIAGADAWNTLRHELQSSSAVARRSTTFPGHLPQMYCAPSIQGATRSRSSA